MQPERLFTSIPEIGPGLARRIHDTPDIDALEELEAATHDGRLAKVPGLGPRRVALLRAALAGLLSRIRPAPERPALQPDVALLLEIDRADRRKADAGELPRITPRRFNPTGEACAAHDDVALYPRARASHCRADDGPGARGAARP